MHFPSEHTLETDEHADGEVQFMHLSKTGKYAVVSFLINFDDSGVESTFFNHAEFPVQCADETPFREINSRNYDICSSVAPAESKNIPVSVEGLYDIFGIKQKDLEKSTFFHYEGSKTTPDCMPGVNWFVYDEVITVKSAINFSPYQTAFVRHESNEYGNNRSVQHADNYDLATVSAVEFPCCFSGYCDSETTEESSQTQNDDISMEETTQKQPEASPIRPTLPSAPLPTRPGTGSALPTRPASRVPTSVTRPAPINSSITKPAPINSSITTPALNSSITRPAPINSSITTPALNSSITRPAPINSSITRPSTVKPTATTNLRASYSPTPPSVTSSVVL